MRDSGEIAMDEGPRIPESVKHKEVYLAALDVLKDTREDCPMSVKDLLSQINDRLEGRVKTYLLYRDVSNASQDPASRISSRKGRGGGYFILNESAVDLDQSVPSKANKQEKVLEKYLWPVVALWLKEVKSVDRVSYEVANLKSGGVWSNPDVVGLSPFEELGFFDVEIVTCEVKPNLAQWRYFFFEAVSHKRFSERSYFIFRSDGSGSHEEELRQYAEKYRVGLVKMDFSDDEVKGLSKWDSFSEEDKTEYVERFVELIPAPFEAISIREKVKFLRQIGVVNKKNLFQFGELD
ncbi:MAG: hypothetical protein HLUCCA12_17615 [Rhodobacteraceae bacterium HLUCCA12]|nr:MAG: hypothetical protein HLUCCA12_17615 [Rhodobacteraceae bacterium HLUCCA12]